LDAEAAFIGAVMHLPAPAATTALGLVPGEDFADPRLAIVADVCRDLAARGTAPDPTAVLAHVQANAVVTGADAVRSLSLLLADLYGTVPTPASVGWYRVAVLDGALRRRCRMLATRVAQAAEGETIESLLALIGAEVAGVLAVQQRRVASGSVDR
jgi:replicative DNA helicase